MPVSGADQRFSTSNDEEPFTPRARRGSLTARGAVKAPRRRRGGQRALVGRDRGAGRAVPAELRRALAAALAQVARVAQDALAGGRDRAGVQRVEEDGGVADHLGQRRRVRAGDGHAAAHRLEHRQAEALVQGRVGERVGHRVEPLELLVLQPARHAHAVGDPQLGRAGTQGVGVAAGVAHQHQRRAALHRGDGLEQPRQVLVRQGGVDRQQDLPVTEREPLAQVGLRSRVGDVAHPEPEVDDVDLRRVELQPHHHLGLGRVAGDLDPMSAPRAGRDEQLQPHPRGGRERVRVPVVDQVVHGHDALEAPVQRAGGAEGVQQLDPLAARHRRQAPELRGDAGRLVAGLHRHAHHAHRPGPGRVGQDLGGLLAAEAGDLPVRPLGRQRAHEPARVDLRAAHLPRHEVHQVHA